MSASQDKETLADIIADLRSTRARFSDRDATALADRLESAVKRSFGNSAKLLATLREIRDDILDMVRYHRNEDPDSYAHGLLLSIGGACDMAMREPPRNCDVGTASEQYGRFLAYCKRRNACADCPVRKLWDLSGDKNEACHFIWSQMPYEAQEKEA